jgi:hypothetical protein
MNRKDYMNLIEFKIKKYWDWFKEVPDLATLKREHRKNENNIIQYYYLKNKKNKSLRDSNLINTLLWRIIWK